MRTRYDGELPPFMLIVRHPGRPVMSGVDLCFCSFGVSRAGWEYMREIGSSCPFWHLFQSFRAFFVDVSPLKTFGSDSPSFGPEKGQTAHWGPKSPKVLMFSCV